MKPPPSVTAVERDARGSGGRRRLALLAWSAAPLIAAAAMAAWTWRKWASPFYDIGRELYTPWQLTLGRSLYADIAYFNGPLSPYLNALWFRLGGVSLTAVIAANLAVLGLFTWLLQRELTRLAGRAAAAAATLVFVAVLAFAQYGPIGNNNFLCPYAHEATHGLLITLAGLAAATRWLERGHPIHAAAAGLCLGAAFLTKTEIFAAGAAGAGVAMALGFWLDPSRRARFPLTAACFLTAASLPAAVGAPLVGGGVLAPWAALWRSRALDNAFLRWVTGLDRPAANAVAMAAFGGAVLAVLALAALAGWTAARFFGRGGSMVAALAALAGVAAAVAARPEAVLETARALPLAVGALLAWSARRLWRARRRGEPGGHRWAILLAWSVFALAMLGKMLLNARFYPYGFALAAPATALVFAAAIGILPGELPGSWRASRAAGAAAAGLAAGLALTALGFGHRFYAEKTFPVGAGGDRLMCTPSEGQQAAGIIARLDGCAPPGASLLVVPEGVIINYLTRRPNPTPHINFVPLEMALAGEERIVADLARKPPDFVVLAASATPLIYGFERFGVPGYGERIAGFIRHAYVPAPCGPSPGPPPGAGGFELLARRR